MKRCLTLLLALSIINSGRSQENPIDQLKKSIVFIGIVDKNNERTVLGTAFLVNIQNVPFLVTAKHVIIKQDSNKVFTNQFISDNLFAFIHSKNGEIINRSLNEIKEKFNVDWISHTKNEVDIALIPFGKEANDDILFIPEKFFLPSDSLIESYDLLYLSYQKGLSGNNKETLYPILKPGSISCLVSDSIFIINGDVFPGNSGSPVFLKPSSYRYINGKTQVFLGTDPLAWRFVGVITAYYPWTKKMKAVSSEGTLINLDENAGLAKVWSADCILEIIDSKAFKEIMIKLQPYVGKK